MVTSIKSIKRKALIKEVIIGVLVSTLLIGGIVATKASPSQQQYEKYCKSFTTRNKGVALSYDEWKQMNKIEEAR